MRILSAVAVVLALFLSFGGSVFAQQRPIVAVFDLEVRGPRFDAETRSRLTDYLGTLLGSRGFRVVPRSQLRARLVEAKKGSYKECIDQSCQIEIGKELAAQKSLASQVLKLGSQCKVLLNLFDLKQAASDGSGAATGPCTEDGVVLALEQAVSAMLGPSAGGAALPRPEKPVVPAVDERQTRQRELEVRLTREAEARRLQAADRKRVLAGPIGKGLEAWRRLLAATLAQGPYLRTAQRRLAADQEARRVALLGMTHIPEGEFVMGCSPGDTLCFPQEQPPHRVWVSEFWMDLTEVTVAAYARCVAAGRCSAPGSGDQCNWKVAGKEQHALGCVDWNQASRYCAWAGKRLPTEAEWEKAARGGTTGATYGPVDDIAWHRENSGGQPHPVGEKQPNAIGLYDMLGSVWEWCEDWYAADYYKDSPDREPRGPATGKGRVAKGGAWDFASNHARVSNRGEELPEVGNDWNGFRCASSTPPAH
jgi:formylglycine-generating enzyme required for sulfatase activity